VCIFLSPPLSLSVMLPISMFTPISLHLPPLSLISTFYLPLALLYNFSLSLSLSLSLALLLLLAYSLLMSHFSSAHSSCLSGSLLIGSLLIGSLRTVNRGPGQFKPSVPCLFPVGTTTTDWWGQVGRQKA
jgi:hypothetical protein